MKRSFRWFLCLALILSVFLVSLVFTQTAAAATRNYAVTGGQLKFDTIAGVIYGYTGNPTKVVIPKTINGVAVKGIAIAAFQYCNSLTSVSISDGVKSIGEHAFWSCENLTDIRIPDSVTSIGDRAFVLCSKLEDIPIGSKNPAYSSKDGVLFNKAKTVLVQFPGGKSGDYSIPNGVKSINSGAFYACENITGVTIPKSVTKIGLEAFYACFHIGDIYIPDSVTSIGIRAFDGCCNAEMITVGANNKVYASEEGVLFNESKTELIQFPGARRGAYTIPDHVTSIFTSAFENCYYLDSIYISKNVKKIGDLAFLNDNELTEAYFYGDAPNVGDKIFQGTNSELKVLHLASKKGFSNPWHGYKTGVFEANVLPPPDGQPDLVVTDTM
ncbi:MAG: leucine-rich repeat domain-containing protein [Bacillota bacterium]|nr:leucine-rich repeat domain-containing protein [Bacillota bacterium]